MIWKWQAIRLPDSVILRSTLSFSMGTRGVDQKVHTRQKHTFTTPTTLAEFMIIVNKTGGIYQKQNWCFSQITFSHGLVLSLRMSGTFQSAFFKWYTNSFKKQSSMLAACTGSDLHDGQSGGQSHTETEVQPSSPRRERGRTVETKEEENKRENVFALQNLSEYSL